MFSKVSQIHTYRKLQVHLGLQERWSVGQEIKVTVPPCPSWFRCQLVKGHPGPPLPLLAWLVLGELFSLGLLQFMPRISHASLSWCVHWRKVISYKIWNPRWGFIHEFHQRQGQLYPGSQMNSLRRAMFLPQLESASWLQNQKRIHTLQSLTSLSQLSRGWN